MDVTSTSPAVSIVVPVRNRDALLPRCLDSIAAQTWRPIRLIVVDNGSTDRTLPVASQWAAAHRNEGFEVEVLQELRPGATHARQRGLDAVATEVVMFFDSDDTMRPDMVATAMRIMADPGVDIACWRAMQHLLDGSHRITPAPDGDWLDTHIIHALLRTQGYAVRTGLLRSVGGWGREVAVWNDWELGVRLLTATQHVRFIDKVLVDVYSQAESITGTGFASKAGKWERALALADATFAANPIKRTTHYRALGAYRKALLAAHYTREGRADLGVPLLEEALQPEWLSRGDRRLLRLLYHWARAGLRGGGRIAVRLL